MIDFNKPEIVFNNTDNKTAVPLTNNVPKTEAEKIKKY